LIDIFENDYTTTEIANKYNISRGTVHNIVYNKYYQDCSYYALKLKAQEKLYENYKRRWKK